MVSSAVHQGGFGSEVLTRAEVRPADSLPWWEKATAPSLAGPWWAAAAWLAVTCSGAYLYAWNLAANGYANEYYAAAVLSMTRSWHAFAYGAVDAVGFITVDKPPFAFWVQALLARSVGFGAWSILLPQAVAALLTVFIVFGLTRRIFGLKAGLLAAALLLLTPINVAMARENLPDPILVLLLVGAAWTTLEALRTGRVRWLLLAALLVGLGFNTKMLQAYVVVPSLSLTYLALASGGWRQRMVHLTAAGAVLAVVSGAWTVTVDAIPADQRPYIGGSRTNSVLELVVGQNGIGRILGRNATAVLGNVDPQLTTVAPGGGGLGTNLGGAAGWDRLFNAQVGGQISWLLPLSVFAMVAGLIVRAGHVRADFARAWFVLCGLWLATEFMVLSHAQGIFHPYYTMAMAPAIAALCGPGIVALWDLYRRGWATAWLLPASVAASAAWGVILLGRSAWLPWLRPAVIAVAVVAVLGLVLARVLRASAGRQLAQGAAALGLIALLAGPATWAQTPLLGGVSPYDPVARPPASGANSSVIQPKLRPRVGVAGFRARVPLLRM